MLKKRIQNKLLRRFIYIASEGFRFNIYQNLSTKVPLVAIWEESEDPTNEEIELIHAKILLKTAEAYFPHYIVGTKYTDERHNTIILKKEGGKWFYRRITWEYPIWAPKNGSIEEIIEELYPTKEEKPVQMKEGAASHSNAGFDTTSLGTE